MDIVTPILNIVSVLCNCSANNGCCYLLDLQENKEALNDAMVELKATRDDVKRRVDEAEMNPNEPMKRTHEVDNWLQRVQTIDDEVVKVIQKVDQEIQGRCFGGKCPKNCWSARKTGKLVIRKLATVNEHRSKGSFGDVAYKLPPSFVQKEPMDLPVGMKSLFDEVWCSLAEDDVKIMGLYGRGGVGKTTLLKQINNKFQESNTTNHGYDIVILVVVSKTLNIKTIQMEIGKRLGFSSTEANKTNIFNALSKKNFLLLLDDIWKKVDLQSIGIPPYSENKSKVIFTSRSETVCGLMDANKTFRVKCLPWDEAWILFQKKVGNEALNSHPYVLELAKTVARECAGLPLALITIGRAMSSMKTVQEWKYAITTLQRYASEFEFPGMGYDVLPLLKLSYDHLGDPMIKSCFLYCALFPEDESIINLPKLIDYWIGEGLISLNESDHIDDARNKGYYVIGILKGACLLETGEFGESLKMHDTIRDLALWIAHDCGRSKRDKMLIIKRSDLILTAETSSSSWYNAERICVKIIYESYDGKVEVSLPTQNSPNLLTLINWWTYNSALVIKLIIPQNFFSFMPLLRVLDLSMSRIETFPTSITELVELRYLSLSMTGIKELPKELGKLAKLNFLDLSHMRCLEKIPSGVIGSLLELRVLSLFGSRLDFDEVFKLKHLNDLGITINTQHNLNKLLSNQSLQMCTRRLHLSSPSPSPSASSSTTTFFFFLIRSTIPLGGGVGNMKSLEKLELLSNLELLRLDSLPDVNMGVWENHYNYMPQEAAPFQNLGVISIQHCNAFKDLTWVGYVVNLKFLCVDDCEELEEIVIIVDDFGGSTREGGDEISMVMNKVEDVFKRLKNLVILDLPKLKSICSHALAFPCLEDITVRKCPQLKKLPFHSGSNLNNTLQQIKGKEEWWNELQWEEEDHDNNELLKSKFLPYFQIF